MVLSAESPGALCADHQRGSFVLVVDRAEPGTEWLGPRGLDLLIGLPVSYTLCDIRQSKPQPKWTSVVTDSWGRGGRHQNKAPLSRSAHLEALSLLWGKDTDSSAIPNYQHPALELSRAFVDILTPGLWGAH